MNLYTNPFVTYLNRYTTVSPEHEVAFDEFITQTQLPSDIVFNLDTKTENFVRAHFQHKSPPSIILTGNAGDGKTFLCRQIIKEVRKEPIKEWEEPDWSIESEIFTLRVVKDLSDFTEEIGRKILLDLHNELKKEGCHTVFLIAANEGRLRAILNTAELNSLRATVDKQLAEGPDTKSGLVVLNLNRATTSSYISKTLDYFTNEAHWRTCESCPAVPNCPILHNRNRLADPHISKRLRLLYDILEHLDVHVTIRDMLIHLAFTITGGLSCKEVIEEQSRPGHKLHRRAYYQNFWGEDATATYRHKIAVINHLRRFNVGNYSLFEIDDFIVNGITSEKESVRNEYEKLFTPATDLKGHHFSQRRDAYLRGISASSEDKLSEFLEWLPHCRRKLFFEWQNADVANRLIPFIFFVDYLRLLSGDQGALDRAKEILVLGLNRAFTGLFLTQKDTLYVTSQYAHAVEQPVPVVRVMIATINIGLNVKQPQTSAFDCDRPTLEISIPHPQRADELITKEINLLRFEYLMRLARGGTHNILAKECSLFIRDLKDKLLTAFGPAMAREDRIDFFGVTGNRYILKTLYVDERRKIRI